MRLQSHPSTGQYTEPTQITDYGAGRVYGLLYNGWHYADRVHLREKYTGPIDMPENTQTIFNAVLVNDHNGKATDVTTRNYITRRSTL